MHFSYYKLLGPLAIITKILWLCKKSQMLELQTLHKDSMIQTATLNIKFM
jgi:hypothetical protein